MLRKTLNLMKLYKRNQYKNVVAVLYLTEILLKINFLKIQN